MPPSAPIRRILAIAIDPLFPIESIQPALVELRQRFLDATIVLLCSSKISQVALSLAELDQVLVHRSIEATGLSTDLDRLLSLIEVLQAEQFDAAIVFSADRASPYPIAYLCYLAGIPIRIGRSIEFGGGVLSQWMNEPNVAQTGDQYRQLVSFIGESS